MTENQETNYHKCGDCRKKPHEEYGSIVIEFFCELRVDDVANGGWENRPACGEFEEGVGNA